MNQALLAEFEERNERIIAAIIQKAEAVCPNSIALIGITGSFCSGEIHERSDLDLCIVINDDDGWKIANCFILGEVAHDIYCTPWDALEAMAEYRDPHVVKLLELDIVYCADETHMDRYLALRRKLQDKLDASFSSEDAKSVTAHLDKAMREYAAVMLSDTVAESKYASARMLVNIEYLIYMANKFYIRRGIRRVPEELLAMQRRPDDFLQDHQALVMANTLEDVQACSTRLLKRTRAFVSRLTESVSDKKDIQLHSLTGHYEEIFSNWRNKMYLAAQEENAYLPWMTAASCQELYDELADEYNMEKIDLSGAFQFDDLVQSARAFDTAMEDIRHLYTDVGEPVIYYANIEEFEDSYLASE